MFCLRARHGFMLHAIIRGFHNRLSTFYYYYTVSYYCTVCTATAVCPMIAPGVYGQQYTGIACNGGLMMSKE